MASNTSNRYTGENNQRSYNSGSKADASNIDYVSGAGLSGNEQLSPFYFYKRALIDLVKEQYFMPLADVRSMP